jgi:hypothetical protein
VLLSIAKISGDIHDLKPTHPLMTIYRYVFQSPPSISSNLEDERFLSLYAILIKLLKVIIDNAKIDDLYNILRSLNIDAMIQTMISIYCEKVEKNEKLLENYVVCNFCDDDCNKHYCCGGKMTQFDKMIVDLGFDIYVFLKKQKILFPDETRLEKFNSSIGWDDLLREEKNILGYVKSEHLKRNLNKFNKDVDPRSKGYGSEV